VQFSGKKPLTVRAGALSLLTSSGLAIAITLCLVGFNRLYRLSIADESSAKLLESQSDKTHASPTKAKLFPVNINCPTGKLGILTGTSPHGEDFQIACSTCHTGRQPNFENRVTADLKEFHNTTAVLHGEISCLSCHNPDDYDSFRLADGTQVESVNVMQLCAQCHGPQMRDYENGVHGGMTGHWDRTRGPQQKLHCVDCHFAHQPKFPQMQPDFKPRDRFLSPSHQTQTEGQH
jgi:formate-dependent nitrite reductase cytochrome c552 subunit